MPKIICGNCKRLVNADRFCSNCGSSLFIGSEQDRSQELEILKEIRDILIGRTPPSPPTSGQKPISPHEGVLEIYLEYKRLSVSSLVDILRSIEKIYKLIYAVEAGLKSVEIDIPTFYKEVETVLRGNPEDRLEIAYICTEASLKLQIKTPGTPFYSYQEGTHVISLPKGVLALVTAATLLGGATVTGIHTANDVYDLQIKKIELKLKQHELEEMERQKLERERELINRIKQAPQHIQNELGKEIITFEEATTRNDEITAVRISVDGKKQD